MTDVTNIVELTQTLLEQAIRAELADRGLSEHMLRNFTVAVTPKDGKLCLSFPFNFKTLKLNAADERAFMNVFNDWTINLSPVPGASLTVKEEIFPRGLRQIECTAFGAPDLIKGVNAAVNDKNKIDLNLLGRDKT